MGEEIENQAADGKDANDTLAAASLSQAPIRLHTRELFRHCEVVEIQHENRIYLLRLTRQNKLILTA